jgi:acyl-CoA synthetase (AMP-forming)/AMP-acid ligase II/thioesterase domain-containing protein
MQLRNLIQLLRATAKAYPEHGLSFYLPGKLESVGKAITYPELLQRAEQNAERIHRLGLRPGSIVLLHFNNHLDNLEWFWAVTLAGFTPAMSTPFSNNTEQRGKHIAYLDSLLEKPLCLTTRCLLSEFSVQDTLKIQLIDGFPTAPSAVDGFFKRDGLYHSVDQGRFKNGTDIAALMLTSGSTGNAKAVYLSHSLILSSVAGKSETLQTGSYTSFFNWIGADHVACLTEIHIHGMWTGAKQVFAQAADIVPNPLQFLNIIHRHGVTHTFAPNFFLASLRRALESPEAVDFRSKLDLNTLKAIVTGGEANVVDTCVTVSKLLEQHGTPSNVLRPAFGMTETCGGSTYSNDFPCHDIERQSEFASVGRCIRGMEMRIVDENGKEVESGSTGSLEVRGPVIFPEYYNDQQATKDSFNGEWFVTGDQGTIDHAGMLNLTGRAKETLIINGVNYVLQEIEAVLEDIEGAKPSYTVAFPHRLKNSPTEGLCIVYCPTYSPDDVETRVAANDAIAKASMLQTGVRPLVIPLDENMLQKTTLGKLSRIKIRKAFENGDYDSYRQFNEEEVARFKSAKYEGPANETEEFILGVFQDIFEVPNTELGVNTNWFTFGINSIDIIKIKLKLEKRINAEVPMITVITNPTIRSLGVALEDLQKPHEYNPMVVLQGKGSKTPLWLIHPGVGEVLIFLTLASHITDRPIYAIRARGFEENEEYFANIEDAVTTYHKKIKAVQPHGPYAIAGYSYGSMIAFEVGKVLEHHNDEVRFLGALNLPPHIKFRMRQLDWTNCLLQLSHFLDFFSEEYAHTMHPILQQQPREEVIAHVLSKAPADRMADLGLDAAKLTNWADLAYSLQSSAIDYEPTGSVQSMDVFCAIPLAAVARDMEDWMTNHLGKWRDFCRSSPRFHCVDGAHYTMISPAHVYSFQKILKAALQDRGV